MCTFGCAELMCLRAASASGGRVRPRRRAAATTGNMARAQGATCRRILSRRKPVGAELALLLLLAAGVSLAGCAVFGRERSVERIPEERALDTARRLLTGAGYDLAEYTAEIRHQGSSWRCCFVRRSRGPGEVTQGVLVVLDDYRGDATISPLNRAWPEAGVSEVAGRLLAAYGRAADRYRYEPSRESGGWRVWCVPVEPPVSEARPLLMPRSTDDERFVWLGDDGVIRVECPGWGK
jgi:hypothetical protein